MISDMFLYFLSQASDQITFIRGLLSLKIIYLRALIPRNSYSSRHKIHVTKLLIYLFFFGISPLRHIIFISFYLILDIPRSFSLLDFLFSIYL